MKNASFKNFDRYLLFFFQSFENELHPMMYNLRQ